MVAIGRHLAAKGPQPSSTWPPKSVPIPTLGGILVRRAQIKAATSPPPGSLRGPKQWPVAATWPRPVSGRKAIKKWHLETLHLPHCSVSSSSVLLALLLRLCRPWSMAHLAAAAEAPAAVVLACSKFKTQLPDNSLKRKSAKH